MYCAHCGKEIENDAKFCPVCGQKVAGSEMASDIGTGRGSDRGTVGEKKDTANNIRKANSDSATQPTSALVTLGVAVLICAYGIVCYNDSSEYETFGMILMGISVVLGIITFFKLKAHEKKYGLSGIGYIAYLICRILMPIMMIVMVFVVISTVLVAVISVLN